MHIYIYIYTYVYIYVYTWISQVARSNKQVNSIVFWTLICILIYIYVCTYTYIYIYIYICIYICTCIYIYTYIMQAASSDKQVNSIVFWTLLLEAFIFVYFLSGVVREFFVVLQCVAVCCSVLQCGAVWCYVLQSAAECCSLHLSWLFDVWLGSQASPDDGLLFWVMSQMDESCHKWMSHVTNGWVMSQMDESCHKWMSDVTNGW